MTKAVERWVVPDNGGAPDSTANGNQDTKASTRRAQIHQMEDRGVRDQAKGTMLPVAENVEAAYTNVHLRWNNTNECSTDTREIWIYDTTTY